jgi:photosystem II stability/assembly factor-like uncharacterized protein
MSVARKLFLSAVLSVCVSGHAIAADGFRDPLEEPAATVTRAANSKLSGIAAAGQRLVAVGARGLIIISDDQGVTWSQIESPVSTDLLDVYFPSASQGWVVGHEGVVLHTADGGKSWTKQLDGRLAEKLFTDHFNQLAAAGDAMAASYLDAVKLNYADGPEQALMDVWFSDDNNGFVVGTFGTILATHDGGKSWESWMEKVDNPDLLHYNAISGVGQDVFIASERGTVFKLDRAADKFLPVQTGYAGTFFNVGGTGSTVIAVGLRGTAYKSDDAGQTWAQIPTGLKVAMTDVRLLKDGRFLLVSLDGRAVVSDKSFANFKPLTTSRLGRFSSIAQQSADSFVAVGPWGAQQVKLQ